MSRNYGGLALIAFIILWSCFWIHGCQVNVPTVDAVEQAHEKEQSWDQENLKRGDHGCPSAVFVAPNGNLIQCQQALRFVLPEPETAPPKYDTAEQAAIAGLKLIASKPSSIYYEWGGVVVKTHDGKYSAMPPNTSDAGDHVAIHGSDFALNSTPLGDYHTHPCLADHDVEYFSAEDMFGAIFFHRLVFMGDFCTGNVHEFVPGDKPDVEHPKGDDGNPLYLSKGRIIGQFTTAHALTVTE